MERIAPLAKILAEANGIEWQGLHGSGEGGQIVEQDILDYLTRVMSGEADPPSTPVDAPPPDWNGEDIPGGGMFDASALSRAGVDTDIAQFVEQSRPAPAPTPAPATPVAADSDFELDDGEEDLLMPPVTRPAPVTPVTQPAPVSVAAAAPAPATSVNAPLPPLPTAGDAPAPVLGRAGSAPAPVTPSAPAAPTPAPSGGLGNLLSRLYQKPAPAAPDIAPAPTPAAPAAEVAQPATPATVDPAPVSAPTPVPAAPVMTTPEPAPAFAAPASAVPEVVAPSAPAAQLAGPQAPEIQVPTPSTPAPEVAAPTPAPVPAAPVFTAPAPAASAQPDAAPAPVQSAPVQAQPPRDAVWFGTYLRREANVDSLMDIHAQLVGALGRDVPLALLLARAAQQHAPSLGLETLAVQDAVAGRLRPVQTGSLRDALAGLDGDFGAAPDLLIVDAGALDLDDLHYPHALSLSIGRVQGGRVGLSLQGDVEPDKAARFLAGVAQALEKPVTLLI